MGSGLHLCDTGLLRSFGAPLGVLTGSSLGDHQGLTEVGKEVPHPAQQISAGFAMAQSPGPNMAPRSAIFRGAQKQPVFNPCRE